MATVVDALIMTLGLDTRDYDKGQKRTEADLDKLKKQSGAVAKEMGEQGKRAAEFFSSIKTELLGLLAVFGAATGLKEFIASNVQGQASLGRLSRNLNVSAQSLQAWGLVAKEMGGQAEDAFGAMQAFAGGLAEASVKGHSALTDTARANGINLEGIKDSEEGLLRISKRLTELPRQQAMYLANELGVGGMFNQLELGPEELKKRLEAAKGLTRVTADSTAAAERLQKRWADIQQRFKETSEIAFARLSPVLERLAERFANWLDSIDWDKVATQIEVLVKGVNNIVQSFGGWKNVAIVLGGILAFKVLAPVLSLVGALGRLVPLLASSMEGLWALAAAGAAVAGGYIGTKIYQATAGTKLGNFFGKTAALGASALGDQDARAALTRDYADSQFSGLPEHVRMTILKARQRAAGGYGGANPTKSQTFGSNAELFASLEKHGNLPAGLLQRMFMQESGGGKNLLSPAGAKGPFQFMDATATEVGLQGNDVYDLDKSAAAAASYLVKLRGMFGGDITKAVAAYNAGPGKVRKYGGVPPFAETQAYVQSVAPGAGQAVAARAPNNVQTSQNTSEMHIGKVEVITQATDAKGIAIDMRQALADHMLVAQADTGIN